MESRKQEIKLNFGDEVNAKSQDNPKKINKLGHELENLTG
jgi:hypothetical protein